MSRYIGPKTKRDRRFNLLAEPPKETKSFRRRKSNYGLQLEEKQKLRYIYGVQEKQFRNYFKKAQKQPKNTGVMLLQQLERRLDNVVYRLGFAPSRTAARQLVNHGHVLVNGRKIDISSYQVRVDEVIALKQKAIEIPYIQQSMENAKEEQLATWLGRKASVGVVKSLPERDQLRNDVDLQLIVEYYSR